MSNEAAPLLNPVRVQDDTGGYGYGDGDASAIGRPTVGSAAADDAARIRSKFLLMANLFAINHGSSLSCLGLAYARLGSVGSVATSALYAAYTGFALLGSPYVVKKWGARDALVRGLAMNAAYVCSFFVATAVLPHDDAMLSSTVMIRDGLIVSGAILGGVGGAVLWTAQGAYFAVASERYAAALDDAAATGEQRGGSVSVSKATAAFGGEFAFVLLMWEVALRMLSSVLIEALGVSWAAIFAVYAMLAIAPVLVMHRAVPPVGEEEETKSGGGKSPLRKAAAALDLLVNDPKAKYLSFINITFGLCTAFAATVINGQVIVAALDDEDSKYVGIYTAVTSLVAAVLSLLFGSMQQRASGGGTRGAEGCFGKGAVLTAGALCYLLVAALFAIFPDFYAWDWSSLLVVYVLLGLGRSTYEGTQRAVFADFFPREREGAFANIILFMGLSSTVGFLLSVVTRCDVDGGEDGVDAGGVREEVGGSGRDYYCVRYTDGTMHDVFSTEVCIIISAILAIGGFWRAKWLFVRELRPQD